MKAMIFCAGLGTRLQPLTNHQPKAMVPFKGMPLIGYQIMQLKRQGITQIIVNVHHFASIIVAYLQSQDWGGLPIHISDETSLLLDTGAGLKKAEPLLQGNMPFLLHNVDIISTLDVQKMLQFHTTQNALATLAVRERASSRCFLFNENKILSGWRNTQTGEQIVTNPSYLDQPFTALQPKAFSGIHIVSPAIFSFLPPACAPYSIIEPYLEMAKTQRIFAYEHSSDLWEDVGTPQKLQAAELLF